MLPVRNSWLEIMHSRAVPAAAYDPAWDEIKLHYRQPGRHYHTFEHIEHCLRVAKEFCPIWSDAALRLSIIYHDVIYDTKRKDNEELSAQLAMRHLATMGEHAASLAEPVAQLVRATANHIPVEGPLHELSCWMLDIDLGILGAPPDVYEHYAQQIRQEYQWVPEPMYRSGRIDVLRKFVQRDEIFRTVVMRERFEAQARENLATELQILSNN